MRPQVARWFTEMIAQQARPDFFNDLKFASSIVVSSIMAGQISASADPSALLFGLVVMRVLSSSIGVLVVFGALAFFYLSRYFKRLTKDAYQDLSSSNSPREPANQAEITPVVVKRLSLRQPLVLALLWCTSLTYLLGDGSLVVIQAVLHKSWEPDSPAYQAELAEIIGLGCAFATAAIALAAYQNPIKLKALWKFTLQVAQFSF